MKTTFAKIILLLLPLAAFAEHGGSVAGGGAETQTDAAAWFTDSDLTKTVHACIVVDAKFGVDTDKIKSLTTGAFQKWANYYESTGLMTRISSTSGGEGCSLDGGHDDRKGFKIATHLSLQTVCDGSEDLTLYFGVSNEDLDRRRNHWVAPYAFAELREPLSSGAHQKAWSKGVVWFAPGYSWSNNESAPLEIALLHEFGHVFGTGHIENTVMTQKIDQQLLDLIRRPRPQSTRAQIFPLYLTIDRATFLVFPPERPQSVPLTPPVKTFGENEQMGRGVTQSVYSILTGMILQDESFSVELEKPASTPRENIMRNNWELRLFASTLVVRGDGVETKLTFKPTSFVSPQTESGIAFKEGCMQQPHENGSIAGYLVRPDGIKKQVVLSINGQNRVQILADPYDPSGYCERFANSSAPCELLNTDFDKIADTLRGQN